MTTSRRKFLAATLTAAGGVALGAALPKSAARAQEKAPDKAPERSEDRSRDALDPLPSGSQEDFSIDAATIAEAEKLSAIEYTPAERGMMVKTLGRRIDNVRARRAVEIDYPVAPTDVFDPRLPGTTVPAEPMFMPGNQDPGPLPGAEEDIAFAPLTALSHWLRTGQISSLDLTRLYLGRLEKYAPGLFCVVTPTPELALEQARAADSEIAAGNYRGPLHGVPWGAKDLLDTKGIRTTWGAAPFRDRVPDSDAAVVRLLREAGAVLVAKTSMGALARGDVWFGGTTRNPWSPEEGSSGSSAGSASAVAAGLVGFAIGTETLGSIVAPAMRCGVAGLRPTFGRTPRTGAMALSYSLDKIGALCRRVEDTALVLQAINAQDAGDPGSSAVPFAFDAGRPVEGMKIGYSPKWFEGERVTDVDRSALGAARAAGLELVEIELPELPYSAMRNILKAESGAAFEALTLSGEDHELTRQGGRAWPNSFRESRFISAIDYVQAQRFRRMVMEVMAQKFQGLDAMISPSAGGPMLVITNFTGHPSLTFRTGFLERAVRATGGDDPKRGPGNDLTEPMIRVPHAVTLWGPLFEDGKLISIGMALEKEFNVWRERPNLT